MATLFIIALQAILIIIGANLALLYYFKEVLAWRDVWVVGGVFLVSTLVAISALFIVGGAVGGGGDGLGGDAAGLLALVVVSFVGIAGGLWYYGGISKGQAVFCAFVSLILLWFLLWNGDYIFWRPEPIY